MAPEPMPTEPKVLGLADIISADDKEYATIPGFKSGEVFRIQSLTADDLIIWSETNEGEAKRTAGLRLIIKSLVDSEGKLILNDTHIGVLKTKSHRITERIVREILKLNGINVKGDTEAKNA